MLSRLRLALLTVIALLAAGLFSVTATAPAAHADPATTCMNPSVSGTATKFTVSGHSWLSITATGSTPASCPTFAASYRYEVRFDVPGSGDVTVASTSLEPTYNFLFRTGTRINFPGVTVGVSPGLFPWHETIVTIRAYATPTRGVPYEESHYYKVPAVGSYDTATTQQTFACLVYPKDWGYTKNCP